MGGKKGVCRILFLIACLLLEASLGLRLLSVWSNAVSFKWQQRVSVDL